MKKLIPFLLSAIFLLTGSCDDDGEYDDGQYGTSCFVSSMSIKDGPTTTFEYDQYGMITSVSTSGGGMYNSQVNFTYNNNLAFADFYMDGQLIGQSEATLDTNSNVVSVLYTDASGAEAAELHYEYNAGQKLVSVSYYDFTLAKIDSMDIEWTNGNATRFITNLTDHRCNYRTGEKSSLRIGRGNVFLQAQFADANIGMFLSEDQMETYDSGSQTGEAMNLTYDIDSDDKIRKIYWSTTSTNVFGTTDVEYECYNSR